MRQIKLGNVVADVVLKDIKNVHLSVYPPSGRVRISAPARMSVETIRVFAISKLDWIKQQQRKLREQERETLREYVDRESHYLWGKRYLLSVVERAGRPSVSLKGSRVILATANDLDPESKAGAFAKWYRDEMKLAASELIAKWEPVLNVHVERYFVQQMKTRWGGCNPISRTIRLNTELAKKPKECLEYIVVHEMAHLIEPTHSARFVALMNQFMPKWQFIRQKLNRLPVRHEEWQY